MRRHLRNTALAALAATGIAMPAAAQEIIWERGYTSGTAYHDVIGTSDRLYVAVGMRTSGSSESIVVTKIDQSGATEWERFWGGATTDDNAWAYGVSLTGDGQILLAGARAAAGYVQKVSNLTGDSLWARSYGSYGSGFNAIASTPDGGSIATGYTVPDGASMPALWVVKLDANGTKSWERTITASGPTVGYAVRATADGGYIVGGSKGTMEGDDFWRDAYVVKLASSGATQWERTLDGVRSPYNEGAVFDVRATTGGFVVVGRRSASASEFDTDILLARIAVDGALVWDRSFGATGSDGGFAVHPTADGGYMIAGYDSQSLTYLNYQTTVFRTDASGVRTGGEAATIGGQFSAIAPAFDRGFLVAGQSGMSTPTGRMIQVTGPTAVVDPTEWTYHYDGEPAVRFRIVSTNPAKKFEGAGPGRIRVAANNSLVDTILINDYIALYAGPVVIDTTRTSSTGAISISGAGRFGARSVGGPVNSGADVYLISADAFEARLSNRTISFTSVTYSSGLPDLRMGGVSFRTRSLELLGGLEATEVRASGTFALGGLRGIDGTAIPFRDMSVARERFAVGTVGPIWYPVTGFLDDIAATYAPSADTIALEATYLSTMMLPGGAHARTGIRDGQLGLLTLDKGARASVDIGNLWNRFQMSPFDGVAGLLFGYPIATVTGTATHGDDRLELDLSRAALLPGHGMPTTKAAVRMMKSGSDWQIATAANGSTDVRLEWDMSAIEARVLGQVEVGRLGTTTLFKGAGTLMYLAEWGAFTGIYGSAHGKFQVPEPGVLRLPKGPFNPVIAIALGGLTSGDLIDVPEVLATGTTIDMSFTTKSMGLVQFPVRATADLTKAPDAPGFLTFVAGPAQPIPYPMARKGEYSLASAEHRDTFDVDASIRGLIVRVKGDAAVSPSAIITPDGTRISGTSVDSSSVLLRTAPDEIFWMLRTAATGAWTLVSERSQSDSVDVLMIREPRALAIAASQQGEEVTVTWSDPSAPAGSRVLVFIDDDGENFDGRPVGEAPTSSGRVTFGLSDSLRECSYHIYAIRLEDGPLASAYALSRIDVARATLPPPTAIVVNHSASTGTAFVTWSRPSDTTSTAAYLVRVTDAAGGDSIVAMPATFQTTTTFTIANATGARLSMASIDSNGIRGCWSEDVSIGGTSAVRYVGTGAGSLSAAVMPNPVSGAATVSVQIAAPSTVALALFDARGRQVWSRPYGSLEAGAHRLGIDLDLLAGGRYTLVVTAGATHATVPVTVR